jgi:hypothetical protein
MRVSCQCHLSRRVAVILISFDMKGCALVGVNEAPLCAGCYEEEGGKGGEEGEGEEEGG